MAPDILILGASGFIGQRLAQRLGASRVLSTYCAKPVPGGAHFDARSDTLESLGRPLATIQHGIILFAMTQIDACAREPAKAASLNIGAAQSVIDQLVERDIVPVFASTDVVFDGRRGDYREDDLPGPILTYGRQKLEIERYLQAHAPRHLILRLPKIIGERPGGGGVFDDWLRAIDAGEPIYCAEDQIFSPIAVEDAVTAMITLIEAGASGTYHVGGARAWDRASLFDAFADALRKHREIAVTMRRCSIRDFPQFAEERPLNVSMSSEKLRREIGFAARGMTEVCAAFAEAAVPGTQPAIQRK
jgi:dTDP-4-dehydrorhamnose reductase